MRRALSEKSPGDEVESLQDLSFDYIGVLCATNLFIHGIVRGTGERQTDSKLAAK